MSMSVAITIEGLSDLSNLLTEQTPRAAKRYLSRCLGAVEKGDMNRAPKAVRVVLDAMDETVPVQIGALESMLRWQKRFSDGDDETTMTVLIGPTKSVFWGSFQEWGTATQEGQHWMGRAWEGCKDEVLNVFATEAIGILQDLENRK